MITAQEEIVLKIERAVIGSCCVEDSEAISLVMSSCCAEYFSFGPYRTVFRAINSLYRCSKPINLITVGAVLVTTGELNGIGGSAFLDSLSAGPARTPESVLSEYCRQLRELSSKRNLSMMGQRIAVYSEDPASTTSEVVAKALAEIEAIATETTDYKPEVAETIAGTRARFAAARQGGLGGIRTGFVGIDQRLRRGLVAGEQTVLAAGVGVGKTTAECQIVHAALQQGRAVQMHAYEPTEDEIKLLIAAIHTGCRRGAITEPETSTETEDKMIQSGLDWLEKQKLRIYDCAAIDLDEMLVLARVGIQRHNVELITVDYLQRLPVSGKEDIRLKVSRASSSIAGIVKGTRCHSLVLSQLTTERRRGPGAIPTLGDLKESSQIEADAHNILLFHREFDEERGHAISDGAVFIPKVRNGQPFNREATFDPGTGIWTVPAVSNANLQPHVQRG
jgi:replicative DNA helicase